MDWSRFAEGDNQQKIPGANLVTHARRKDESLLPIDLSLTPFLFKRQRYFSAVFSNMYQKMKILEKNKFLAFLSHEIRNPLQVRFLSNFTFGEPQGFSLFTRALSHRPSSPACKCCSRSGRKQLPNREILPLLTC